LYHDTKITNATVSPDDVWHCPEGCIFSFGLNVKDCCCTGLVANCSIQYCGPRDAWY